MFVRTFPKIHRRLTATAAVATIEMFEPITPWCNTLEALAFVQCVIILAGKNGNFECRLGIQTAATDPRAEDGATNFSSFATQITAADDAGTFIRVDPNGATDGNIDTKMWFRIGILYSLSSGTTPASGDVIVEGLSWR